MKPINAYIKHNSKIKSRGGGQIADYPTVTLGAV
jgi:hypothetical protein